jgi:phenylpropionate dioxygenase-like ring-hydroxylating dioxygenase large terminal subunit
MTLSERLTYTEAASIPKNPYLSIEWLALEYKRLWPRVWQMAGRLEEIRDVGDFVEYTIGDQSILIVRESPSSIKAFNNACLHQGTRLCSGSGNAGAELQCPFHGWAWHLDGSILEVPDSKEFAAECVRVKDLQLPEVHLDIWGGFVFINMSSDPEPLLDFLSPIPERLAPFEFEKMRLIRYRTSIMECNWKTAVHSFNEAYHLEATHVWDLSQYCRDNGLPFRVPPEGEQDTIRGKLNTRDSAGSTIGSYTFSYEIFDRHNMMRMTPESLGKTPLLGELGDPREVALTILQVRQDMNLAHQDELDYVHQLDNVPADVPVHAFMNEVRRAVGRAGGVDYSHISDDDLLANIDYFFYPNMIGPGTAGNQIIYRVRPNGMDPDTCIFDVMALHRYPDGVEPPKVQHEWYPDWRDHQWYPAVGQHFATMGLVQAGMRQRSFTSIRKNRMEAGNRNHNRFIERYLQDPGD